MAGTSASPRTHSLNMAARLAREREVEALDKCATEPASAIYFRNLKRVYGSQDRVSMTTDVGAFR